MAPSHPIDAVPQSFWETIELARKERQRFTAALDTMDREGLLQFIWAFEEIAAEFKYEPFTECVDSNLSEDGIDDVATWVVEQGREYAQSVFDDASRMPERVDHPVGLLSEAVRAFYRRFGGPIPLP
jgi:hypothetical protein